VEPGGQIISIKTIVFFFYQIFYFVYSRLVLTPVLFSKVSYNETELRSHFRFTAAPSLQQA
jgi:hypothetical protein